MQSVRWLEVKREDKQRESLQARVAQPFPDLRLSLTKMEDEGMGKGKMQAVSTSQPPAPPGHLGDPSVEAPPPISYEEERAKRVLYSDPQLHLTVNSFHASSPS